jgi:hypothetical protein
VQRTLAPRADCAPAVSYVGGIFKHQKFADQVLCTLIGSSVYDGGGAELQASTSDKSPYWARICFDTETLSGSMCLVAMQSLA